MKVSIFCALIFVFFCSLNLFPVMNTQSSPQFSLLIINRSVWVSFVILVLTGKLSHGQIKKSGFVDIWQKIYILCLAQLVWASTYEPSNFNKFWPFIFNKFVILKHPWRVLVVVLIFRTLVGFLFVKWWPTHKFL